jgi:diadenosine tetraphosphate (Ap4A) HIT family hydrolase
MTYDPNNIFAKILRREIPAKIVYEDDYVLAFHDIQPKRKIHVLVIPKGAHATLTDFGDTAAEAEIVALWRAIPKIVDLLGLRQGGYRAIINTNLHGGQEVPHLHVHLIGGEAVGPMVS